MTNDAILVKIFVKNAEFVIFIKLLVKRKYLERCYCTLSVHADWKVLL